MQNPWQISAYYLQRLKIKSFYEPVLCNEVMLMIVSNIVCRMQEEGSES